MPRAEPWSIIPNDSPPKLDVYCWLCRIADPLTTFDQLFARDSNMGMGCLVISARSGDDVRLKIIWAADWMVWVWVKVIVLPNTVDLCWFQMTQNKCAAEMDQIWWNSDPLRVSHPDHHDHLHRVRPQVLCWEALPSVLGAVGGPKKKCNPHWKWTCGNRLLSHLSPLDLAIRNFFRYQINFKTSWKL